MEAYIMIKPTAHKSICMVCGREIEKGEIVIRVEQVMYPGFKTGYICKQNLKW